MKSLLSIACVLLLLALPGRAQTYGLFHASFGGTRGHYGYSTGHRHSFGYAPFYGYGYGYGAYGDFGALYEGYSFDNSALSYTPPAPATPNLAALPPTPSHPPLGSGFLDVQGFVHSPYSEAVFKIANVRSGQMVYDPATGRPFLVR